MKSFLFLLSVLAISGAVYACDGTSSSQTWTTLVDTGPNSPSGPTGLDTSMPLAPGTYYIYGLGTGNTNCVCTGCSSGCCSNSDFNSFEVSAPGGTLTGTATDSGTVFDDQVPLKDHSGVLVTFTTDGVYTIATNAVGSGVFYAANGAFGPSITITISSAVGGGGDPHLFSPFLPNHFELHHTLAAITGRSSEQMDATLISSDNVRVVGHTNRQPGTEKHFFTSFTVEFAEGSPLTIGYEVVDGRAYAFASDEWSCASGDSLLFTVNSCSGKLDCTSNAIAQAAVNAVVAEHFRSHIAYTHAALTLETADFDVEFFFVQKDLENLDFGFFDFSISPHAPAGEELGGIFGDVPQPLERSTHTRTNLAMDVVKANTVMH